MHYTYYLPMRPPAPGTVPRIGLVEMEDFGEKVMVESIGRFVWGKVIYSRELGIKELRDYELVPEFYNLRFTLREISAMFDLLSNTPVPNELRAQIANKFLEVSPC